MNDALLIQQCWPNNPYVNMMELTKDRNEEYCKTHGFDFKYHVGIVSEKYGDYNIGSWVKVEMIQQALSDGYKYVIFHEPDTMIKDLDADLRDGCPIGIGACYHRIPQGNHWNVGALYFQKSEKVINFVNEWLSRFPGPGGPWREQGIFNTLGMEGRIVQTISDRWNSTLNVNMVPDAVVLGFHGAGTPDQRYELMKSTLETLRRTGGQLVKEKNG